MNLIFLNIDGVLNNEDFCTRVACNEVDTNSIIWAPELSDKPLSSEMVELAKTLIKIYSANIVIMPSTEHQYSDSVVINRAIQLFSYNKVTEVLYEPWDSLSRYHRVISRIRSSLVTGSTENKPIAVIVDDLSNVPSSEITGIADMVFGRIQDYMPNLFLVQTDGQGLHSHINMIQLFVPNKYSWWSL